MSGTKPLLRAGFLSRFDYGGNDYRVGLWRLAFDIFKEEGVEVIYFAGGLVDSRALLEEWRRLTAVARAAKADLAAERENFLNNLALELAKLIPTLHGVKIYLTTSPPYDGWIGEEVAARLVENHRDALGNYRPLRPDIYHTVGRGRHVIKAVAKTLGVYTPEKGVWMRGDYFSTPVMRVLKDEDRRSSHGLSDFNAVGCFASSTFDPGDSTDVQRPGLSLPALARLGTVRTSDNQIGVTIVDVFSPNLREAMVTTYNFKDLLADEARLVRAPAGSSAIQKAIVKAIGEKRPLSIGLLEDATGYTRAELAKPLEQLLKKPAEAEWPGIIYYEANRSFGFDRKWFQQYSTYPRPAKEQLVEDRSRVFGCLHAGCKWTDMKFFSDEMPQSMLKHDDQYLIGVGDFIEGLYHSLRERGEIILGRLDYANYTVQEELAAYLVARVLLTVFEARLKEEIKKLSKKKLTSKKTVELAEKSLPTHLYIEGNHCGWVEPLGFESLATYSKDLHRLVAQGVRKILAQKSLCVDGVDEMVARKIIRVGETAHHTLPSGLVISLHHPGMAGTKTPSIRAQGVLRYSDALVAFAANFHTHHALAVHDPKKGGQRFCLQTGTLKVKSGFEESKLKTVDTGVGFLNVVRQKDNGRIWKTTAAFFGTTKKDLEKLARDNDEVLADFEKDRQKLKNS